MSEKRKPLNNTVLDQARDNLITHSWCSQSYFEKNQKLSNEIADVDAQLSAYKDVVGEIKNMHEKMASILKMREEEPWEKGVVSSDALLDFAEKELHDALSKLPEEVKDG